MELQDEAAIYLEDMHVSGDSMVEMDHCIEELGDKVGSYYLYDLLAGFAERTHNSLTTSSAIDIGKPTPPDTLKDESFNNFKSTIEYIDTYGKIEIQKGSVTHNDFKAVLAKLESIS